MAARSSYFQRLAAPLGTGPSLYPLAQAAPGEARPQVGTPPITQPNNLASASEAAAPTTTIRRKQVASTAQKAAAQRGKVSIPLTQPEKVTPELPAVAAVPKTAAQAAAKALEPEDFAPAKREEFPASVTAMPSGTPAANHSEFEAKTLKPAALPLAFPAQPALIWGEPITLSQKSAAASPFEPAPTPARPSNRQNSGTEIHIGTIEVRSEAATPKAPVPPPAPAPRAAPPPPTAPFSRAYGWRFGLSQR